MNTLDLTIDGMHCDGCAGRIQSLLEKEAGISEITISAKAGTGQIAYSPHLTNEKQIVAIIERAGFTVGRA